MDEEMDTQTIHKKLRSITGYNGVYVPEFTFGDLRIDAIIIDIRRKWIKGFEIKLTRKDFKRDDKWHLYTQFCSTLSIVCPEGLIQPEEIKEPFGLLWIGSGEWHTSLWKKRPKRFQHKDSLAWMFTYLKVLELEIRRLDFEMGEIIKAKESGEWII